MALTQRLPKRGFTLIELLIIIGIIGFLAAAILVAVDPVKRLGDAQDAKRWAEVNAILNAILQKQVDDKAYYNGATGVGEAPIVSHATNYQVIVRATPPVGACTAAPTTPVCPGKLLSALGVACVAQLSGAATATQDLAPAYIAELPLDPKSSAPATGPAIGNNNTGYYIHRVSDGGRIEIGSCWPSQAASISVKR